MKIESKNFLFLFVGAVFGLVGIVGFFSAINTIPLSIIDVAGYAILFGLGIAILSRYKG